MATRKSKSKSKRTVVVSRHGRFPFQRGIITAALLQRGLSMNKAFHLSGKVRHWVDDRREVDASEIEALLEEYLRDEPQLLVAPEAPSSTPTTRRPLIRSQAGILPFSRGILLRRLTTIGLELEPAIAVADEATAWLGGLNEPEIPLDRLSAFVADQLADAYGEPLAQRYRLLGWIRNADKPVILMLGGATGTGKSTLATDLAFRLGINRVTGTDMIRETLRTVLSRDVVPGLHDHSFRGVFQGGQMLSNPRERVLAGFRQQAAQVAVGIRAVVGRAIQENAHLIIEGTHLLPPFTRYIPAGADVHIAGMVLSIPDERTHRERFAARARFAPNRPVEAYLEAFQAVRWIHDDVTQMADESDVLVLTDRPLDQARSALVGYLSEALPVAPIAAIEESSAVQPSPISEATLFLILDGMPDEPNAALSNQTPLQAARTPTLRALAGVGAQGLIQTGTSGGKVAAGTGDGLLALLADRDTKLNIGRGLLEALGQGIHLPSEGVVIRGNLATVEPDGQLSDRRAGRIREGQEDLLRALSDVPLGKGIRGSIHAGHEHRVVVLLQGEGLSSQVSDTDPSRAGVVSRRLAAEPTDKSKSARRTADALNTLLEIAHKHLSAHPHNEARSARGLHPANCIITRGAAPLNQQPAGRTDEIGAVVSGCSTAMGVARFLGFQTATSREMTGNLDTNLNQKFTIAGELLEQHDLVVIHIKGTDIAAHDRRPLAKRDFIERIDKALGRFLKKHEGLRVVISADHPTSSRSGDHMAEPVPVLIGSWEGKTEDADFDEDSARTGVLGTLKSGDLMELLREA